MLSEKDKKAILLRAYNDGGRHATDSGNKLFWTEQKRKLLNCYPELKGEIESEWSRGFKDNFSFSRSYGSGR